MKKVLEPIMDSAKQTAQETIGVNKDITKAIELKGEGKNKTNDEKEELIKSATNFDLRKLKTSSEICNSKNISQYRLQVNLSSNRLYILKKCPLRFLEEH